MACRSALLNRVQFGASRGNLRSSGWIQRWQVPDRPPLMLWPRIAPQWRPEPGATGCMC